MADIKKIFTKVSIVVRIFNEAFHLEKLFRELSAQSLKDFEIIAVDSGSTDNSVEIAEKCGAKIIKIKSEDFTFGFSLNRGIEAGAGEYIAIVSAHTYPIAHDWLKVMVSELDQDENHALAYGKQIGIDQSKRSEKFDFERLFPSYKKIQKAPDYFCNNANSMIRKKLWEEHPFDESLTGLEDIAWAKYWMDRGKTIAYLPDAGIAHIHNETWHQVENRYYREMVAARHIGIVQASAQAKEIYKASINFGKDLVQTVSKGELKFHALREISNFRLCQLKGNLKGCRREIDLSERHDLYFPDKNSAVIIRAPNDAVFDSIPVPTLKPNDVLIKISTVGVCMTDLEVFRGTLGYFKNGLSNYPIVPGHEYSGEIVAVGSRVRKDFIPGKKVVGECILSCGKCAQCEAGQHIACRDRQEVGVMNFNGAYATYICISSQYVHLIPDDADYKNYAVVEPLAVIQKAVARLSLQNSETKAIGILGAGPLGNLAAQTLAHLGHRVTIFETNHKRLSTIGSEKIHRESEIKDLHRFDIIIETTGKYSVLNEALKGSSAGSDLLLLGFPYKEMPFNFENIVAFDRKIIGSVGSRSQDFANAIQLIPKLDLEPFKQAVYPIDQFREAWSAVERQEHLKVMLEHS